MKIALIGYGQMGKMIDDIATKRGHQIVSKIDPFCSGCYNNITLENLNNCDVCIEFTEPKSAFENVCQCNELNQKIVCGTTGWLDKLDKINVKNALVWGTNFSVGMNAFFKIIDETSKIMNKLSGYDVLGYEMHHKKKKDSPSGTAKTISDIILQNYSNKNTAQFEKLDRKIHEDEFHFASIRGGNIPGTHTIIYDSLADSIELKHTARNRNGFALGAILAAEWVIDKQGIFEFRKYFGEMI